MLSEVVHILFIKQIGQIKYSEETIINCINRYQLFIDKM